MRVVVAALLLLVLATPVLAASVSAQQDYKQARVLATSGKWQEALEVLERVLADDAMYVDAVYLAGLCHMALEQYDRAEVRLKRTTELKPDFFPAWQYLARLYLATKQKQKARETLGAMGRLKGGAPESHYGFGVLAWMDQDLAAAEKEWREAIRLDPQMAKAHHNLGILYLEKMDRARALSDLQDAVRLAPDHPLYRYTLGALQLDMGRKTEGMQNLDRVRSQTDRPDVANLALATQMLANGHPEQAEKAAARALEANSELTTAMVVRAKALEALNRLPEARELFERALADDPNLREARQALERIPPPTPVPGTEPPPEAAPGAEPEAAPEAAPEPSPSPAP